MLKNKRAAFLLIIFFCGQYMICIGQNDSSGKARNDSAIAKFILKIEKERDSVGIAVTKKYFDSIFNYYNSYIKVSEKSEITTKEYIEIMRIYNTIGFIKDYKANNLYFNYQNRVYDNLLLDAVEKLCANESIGGSFYSIKHKLYIGGLRDSNSMYRIIE